MVMGVLEGSDLQSKHPELVGARVLITGLEAGHGVDIARAFAEQGCRLVLQVPGLDTPLEVLLETLVRDAQDVQLIEGAVVDEASALKCAQYAAGVFGGLDAVINLAKLDDAGLDDDASEQEVEDRLADTLRGPLLITRVIASRMELTWREGLILNIVTQQRVDSPAAFQLGRIARAALSTLTKREAYHWAESAVRVNAVVPASNESCEPGDLGAGLRSEPEIASVAIHLASRKGKTLSGLVFDASLC